MELQFNHHHGARFKQFHAGDPVYAKDFRPHANRRWLPATVVGKKGSRIYKVQVGQSEWLRHANHLRRRVLPTSPQAGCAGDDLFLLEPLRRQVDRDASNWGPAFMQERDSAEALQAAPSTGSGPGDPQSFPRHLVDTVEDQQNDLAPSTSGRISPTVFSTLSEDSTSSEELPFEDPLTSPVSLERQRQEAPRRSTRDRRQPQRLTGTAGGWTVW